MYTPLPLVRLGGNPAGGEPRRPGFGESVRHPRRIIPISGVPSRDLRVAGFAPLPHIEGEESAMPDIQWGRDVDAAMTQARAKAMPLLLDFNAAPM